MESPQQASSSMSPIGVYEDEEDEQEEEDILQPTSQPTSQTAEFEIDMESIDFESDDYEDPEFLTEWELQEADRLIQLVQGTSLPKAAVSELEEPENSAPTTSITDEDALREAKRRRKKLIKNLKAIDRLVAKQNEAGFEFNEEQQSKVDREIEWRAELESVEHNLQ
jgi:hypothetical protein